LPVDGLIGSAMIYIGPNYIKSRNGSWSQFTTLDTSDNTDRYHEFRISRDPSLSYYQVWKDGVLLFAPQNSDVLRASNVTA
jgi:hypothetical protein